ncbi:hypothetical protein T484DRAFT_1817426 [Baffinella frigidus]|nr:hypothetical protein T484DRAFT_1817426 [Cryptophyta sp. CCMP2293]
MRWTCKADGDPEIKAVFTDVDGTLLNSKHQLSPRTVDALKATMARGIPVVMATGLLSHPEP